MEPFSQATEMVRCFGSRQILISYPMNTAAGGNSAAVMSPHTHQVEGSYCSIEEELPYLLWFSRWTRTR